MSNGGTGALEITPHSSFWLDGMGWNQHRRTYGPAFSMHFDWPKDDNARPHRAHLVENMIETETIQRKTDLNPIEHVWDNCCAKLREDCSCHV
ncbi:hypothetical protein TNCV_582781 [Trichonephila clavipes]|nr:hypothetical protein TNCV_582781 [Trichonephila clavipes]